MATPAPAHVPQDRDTPPLAVGASIFIKGTITSSGDIYLNGEVEGRVEATNSTVTVGPNAKVLANLEARKVVVSGTVNGNIKASEAIELLRTSTLNGNITTARIKIDDGAFIKGTVDVVKG
jgi:cytoskeletal protein CcmA (bactofilin family)